MNYSFIYIILVLALAFAITSLGQDIDSQSDVSSTLSHHQIELDSGATTEGQSSSSSHSLFGIMVDIRSYTGSISIIVIVFAVLFVEKVFHGLHALTHDTPFQDMVSAIEKELMIVGSMAFIFKVIINTTSFLNEEWLVALEYADLVVPITSFFYCIEGMVLILVSVSQCDVWSKAYHMKLFELLDEFLKLSPSYQDILSNRVNSELEFRMFHCIFCEQYRIQRDAFAFDDYVQRIFEKFLLDIVTIQPMDWIMVCVLVLLNWGRRQLHWDFKECDSHDPHILECEAEAAIEMFTFFGGVIFLFTVALMGISRIYEIRVLGTRGINKGADYIPFLQYAEDHINPAIELHRLSESALKTAVSEAKSLASLTKSDESEFQWLARILETIYDVITCRKAPSSPEKAAAKVYPQLHSVGSVQKAGLEIATSEPNGSSSSKASTSASPSNRRTSTVSKGIAMRNRLKSSEKASSEPDIENQASVVDGIESVAEDQAQEALEQEIYQKFKEWVPVKTNLEEGHSDELSRVFLWGKPNLYFDSVEIIIMVIALYMALWITNFLSSASLELKSTKWVIISLLPGLFSCLGYIYVVKCAALLKAVVYLNHDCVEETLEEMEGARMLGESMRHKILSRLNDMGEPEAQLYTLFREIDDNGSNLLSRREFQIFLDAMGISFSRKRWKQIFREIDKNFDDEISFQELFLFLFPDHDQALAEEMKRLKMIKKRVKNRMNELRQDRRGSQFIKSIGMGAVAQTVDRIPQSPMVREGRAEVDSVVSNAISHDEEHGVGVAPSND